MIKRVLILAVALAFSFLGIVSEPGKSVTASGHSVTSLASNTSAAVTGSCTISSPPNSTQRIITLVVDCPVSSWIKLSEAEDFGESPATSTVRVDINSVASDNTYADISITYQNEISGGTAEQFYVQPTNKELNVLAVRYVFEDASGNIAGVPNYMSDVWLERVVFGNTVGFDNQPTANSIKKHIEHNTYGRVKVSGETYPRLVRLSLERYFDPLGQATGTRNVLEGITDFIAANDPEFLNGKAFDFVVGFSPDHYSVLGALEALSWGPISPPPAHPSIEGFIVSQAPITTSSILYGAIVDEPVTSVSATTVATKYDPISVSGVWLAGDPGHSGTNYYAGGRLVGRRGSRYLELGAPLPAAVTPAIVSYTPSVAQRLSPGIEALFPPDSLILPGDRWYSRYIHELYHAMSRLLSFNGLQMGDLYKEPARLEKYDLMDNGENNRQLADILGDGVPRYYYEPSYLSGYSKLAGELVFPYTLAYGSSESSLRLHKSEEADFSDTNERVKLIKIPLRPKGDPGFQSMSRFSKDKQYAGEEYLLLEWRYRGALGATERNFDAYLPSEGLVITHVIHNSHYNGTNSTGFGANIVRIIDATPPPLQEEGYSDTPESPALFGALSGVYTYESGVFWQQTTTGQLSVNFLLSEGAGDKTVYAKFKDGKGNIIGLDTLVVNLEDSSTSKDRMPSMSIVSPEDNSVVITDPTWVTINIDAPNEVVRTFIYHDGAEFSDVSGQRTTDFIRSNEFSGDGFHTKRWVAYDRAGLSFEETLPFYLNQSPLPNQSPLADAGADQTLNDVNNDGFITAVLNGQRSLDPDGIIITREWYDATGALLSNSSVHALKLSGGIHSFSLVVTDNLGATAADSLSISVNTSQRAPMAPSDLSATAPAPTEVHLAWFDNSLDENVFEIERSPDGTVWDVIASMDANTTAYVDKTVLSNIIYHYRVRAHNGGGPSQYSNVATATTPPEPPAAPTDLVATAASSIQVELSWTDNADSEESFEVERSFDGTGWSLIATLADQSTGFSDTGLLAGTTYHYRVRAQNGAGRSSYSNVATATTPPEPPAAPTDLVATAASSIQVELSWTDNADNEESFEVERSFDGTGWSLIATLADQSTGFSDTGLLAGTTYHYRVRAVNVAGASAYSEIKDVLTFRAIGLSATTSKVKGRHEISLEWNGIGSLNVGIYRGGILIAEVVDYSMYTDQTENRGKGTYTYQVCEQGSAWGCSNLVTVEF